MPTLILYAQYTASKVGKTGLTPTITVKKITKTSSAITTIATAAATTELFGGLYFYSITNADLTTYDYAGIFNSTDGTVDQQDIPAAFSQYGANSTLAAGDVSGNLPADIQTIKTQIITATTGITFPASIGTSTLTAGAQMDFVNAPNATAISAIQNGLSTLTATSLRVAIGLSSANLDTQLASILTAVGNLNNLSALANLYGPSVLEIPDSSSTAFPFTLTVRDSEGHLADLDALPTLTATNAAATDRSGNLSALARTALGRYNFTYTVASNAAEEGVRIEAAGAVNSSARYAIAIVAVANYDSITTLAAIKAKTDNLPSDPTSETNATTNRGTITTAITTATSPLATTTLLNTVGTAVVAIPLNPLLTTDSRITTLVTNTNAIKVTTDLLATGWTVSASKIVFTAQSLANAPTGGGGSGFSGPYSCTIIFEDANEDAVSNVVFRFVGGTGGAATDGNGQTTIGLNQGSYDVLANPQSGTAWERYTLTVTTAASQTFRIPGTAVAVLTPSDPEKCYVTIKVVRQNGSPAAGQILYFSMKDIPAGNGTAFLATGQPPVTATAGSDGTVNVQLFRLSSWNVRGSIGKESSGVVNVPDAPNYAAPNMSF